MRRAISSTGRYVRKDQPIEVQQMVHTELTIQSTPNGCRVRGTPILKVQLYVHFGHEAEEKRQLAWRKEYGCSGCSRRI